MKLQFSQLSLLFLAIGPMANAQNLVTNGNFSSGNTGFTSDLALGSLCRCSADSYCVGTQLISKCSGWSDENFHDHTSGSGNFLIIDGSPDDTPDLWKQDVTISSGMTYAFGFWARSVNSEETYPLSVTWVINETALASSLSIPHGEWTFFYYLWDSEGTSGSIEIALRQATEGAYYELGIDDIFFKNADVFFNTYDYKQGMQGYEVGTKIAADNAITVYPNPSNGSFAIQLSGTQEQSVFVYNATGKVVFEKLNTSQKMVEVDLNELSKGIYLVKVLSGDKQEVKKIIVQ